MAPRIAIVGSCVTRDLWPVGEEAPKALLYISRTSLPSLVAPRPAGIALPPDPRGPLKRFQDSALRADIEKTALEALVDFRPTHLLFDFIDERFDLLRSAEGVITRSWELTVSGYLDGPNSGGLDRVPRLSAGCDRLWADALGEMAAAIAATPLRHSRIVLHSSRWAMSYRTADGVVRDFEPVVEIMPGDSAAIEEHNALLARYDSQFLAAFPDAATVASKHRLADESHRWGLSPFHYVDAYYRDIRDQLARL